MKKFSVIALGLLVAAQVHAAAASDGTVNFTGNIDSQTCTVSVNGGTNTGTVTLPKIAAAVLANAGQTAGETRFTIDLKDCSTQTGNVYAYFEQGANVNENGRLTNTGSAQNVELQLRDSNEAVINVGSTEQSTSPVTGALSEGAASLIYSAEYFATDKASAGTVVSSVTYSINYL
ncbi:fimbrial protein [Pantoea sp. KPR_PJ]|uniref:fimbrial protein n=1 Tax=Pantoea sp. KPR_PJ TaxID=2738375 RepID=UPI0035273AF2